MSEEFGLTNSGDNVVQVPVETKEPVLIPVVPVVEKKKRGRPKKVVAPVQEKFVENPKKETVKPQPRTWRCSSCQEEFDDKSVMKIGAGTNRWAVFCPMCQRSFGFQDQEVLDKVQALIKNNPTGK